MLQGDFPIYLAWTDDMPMPPIDEDDDDNGSGGKG
jgi:hypothetical protein